VLSEDLAFMPSGRPRQPHARRSGKIAKPHLCILCDSNRSISIGCGAAGVWPTCSAAPLPGDGPIGEAWILSDRDDHPSRVADGPLKGRTIGQLMEQCPEQLMGKLAGRFHRFPLLLKFLDAREMLSVQVHPSDAHKDLLPAGETGKTEAWVVLEAGTESRIYAGLKPGTTRTFCGARCERDGGGHISRASLRSPATASSYRLGRFTLWAAAWWCSKFSRTAT
jgi:hypothetical protein